MNYLRSIVVLSVILCPNGLFAEAPDGGTTQLYGAFAYARSARLPEDRAFRGGLLGISWAQNGWLRWTGDIGFERAGSGFHVLVPSSSDLPAVDWKMDQFEYQLQLGPEFTKRSGRWVLFAHALPGYGIWALSATSYGGPGKTGDREGGFSLAMGGGADLRISKHFGLRLFQADYMPVWLEPGHPSTQLTPPLPPRQGVYHNTRIAFGIILTTNR
jgi:hypothetical protein